MNEKDTSETMKGIAKRIAKRRLELGMSYKDLADKVGMSKSSLQRYETGYISKIPLDKVQILASALDTDIFYLLGLKNAEMQATQTIPVYSRVPAGNPNMICETAIDYITIPATWQDEYVGLEIKGDSMFPKYAEGDIVIVRLQDDCENGDECIVFVNGCDATLKKVIKLDKAIILQPLNPEYEPKIFQPTALDPNPVSILGKVVEIRRRP